MSFKKIIFYIITTVTIIMFTITPAFSNAPTNSDYISVTGKVIKENNVKATGNNSIEEQYVTVMVLTEPYKGQTFNVKNSLLIKPWPNIELEKGDKVVLTLKTNNGKPTEAFLSEYGRINTLYLLVLLFIGSLVVIGGKKGLKAVIALALSGFSLFIILLPLLLTGYNPLKVTILILAGVTLITMITVGGINQKTLAATLGTIGGVVIAGTIAYYSGELLNLTGVVEEEAQALFFIPGFEKLNFKGLLFAGMVIGALGATMDVSISIASTIEEVRKANYQLSPLKLFIAGMNVGRDVMGTMANTLILAYVGGAMPTLLLLAANHTPAISYTNSELIATEIVRALSGSIGLIFTVPITSILAAFLMSSAKPCKR